MNNDKSNERLKVKTDHGTPIENKIQCVQPDLTYLLYSGTKLAMQHLKLIEHIIRSWKKRATFPIGSFSYDDGNGKKNVTWK